MKCNLSRVKQTIDDISKFNKTPNCGITRFSYSEEDKRVREYLINEFKKLDLEVTTDAVGNIRAKLIGKNRELPIVLIGSHIDSVYKGGKFDGVLGVVAALEVIRIFKENRYTPNNTVEIIVFAEEEGSNFNSITLGSKCVTGSVTVEDLKVLRNHLGISAYDVMKSFGLNPDNLKNDVYNKEDLKAMLELHIEQGVDLDRENKSIGIVSHIVGMETLEVKIKGQANHAGSTSMDMRSDALLEASKLIIAVNNIVNESTSETAVATIGSMDISPNVSNVIAGEVTMRIDVRDVDDASIQEVISRIKLHIHEVNQDSKCSYSLKTLASSESVELSGKIINEIRNYVSENNIGYSILNSGSAHDAGQMASLTDVGMIFVPSINGKSHSDEEATEYKDINIGCNVLLDVVLSLT